MKKRAKSPKSPSTGAASVKAGLFARLADLYGRMDAAYAAEAGRLGLSCAGCDDNCCVSFFQHHTLIEWAYLFEGLKRLPEDRRGRYLERADNVARQARALSGQGFRPKLMCPLNDEGLCGVYGNRLMICRMHGVPNRLRTPDGRVLRFPGCGKTGQASPPADSSADLPADDQDSMDRTPFYRELAALERDFATALLGPVRAPRIDLTLAEMLTLGPPTKALLVGAKAGA